MTSILTTIVGLLPSSRLKNYFFRLLGWNIETNVSIGTNLFLNLQSCTLRKNCRIRAFNIFRGISLYVGEDSVIGSWNWVSSAGGLRDLDTYSGSLHLGMHSAINSRNYFDVSGGLRIGNYSDFAGVRSTVITHQIDLESSIQSCSKIVIGDFTMVCSNSMLVPGGTEIEDQCLFAMGSVIKAGFYPSGGMYAGNPAKFKKQTSGEWFSRKLGKV